MAGARIPRAARGRRRKMDNAISETADADQCLPVIQVAQHRHHAQLAQQGSLVLVADEPIYPELWGEQRRQPGRHIAEAHDQYSHRLSIV